jgi:glycosyltransferase involved in cell wall biosynthesis
VPKLTVTIIARDEAAHIAAALTSVAWADERIVVDSGSTDDTIAIARPLATRVEVREWPGYGAQKNAAAALASHDWVLSLDADERVSPALAAEIQRVLTAPTAAAYRMPRVTWYLGQWIRSTDWYPDSALRLYDRTRATWGDEFVHESLRVDGDVGALSGELEHRPYDDVADHLARINHYTTLAAAQMHRQGRRAGVWHLLGHPVAAFLRNYIARGGFKQGGTGLVVSLLNATYVLLKFAKLYECTLRDTKVAAPGTTSPSGGER